MDWYVLGYVALILSLVLVGVVSYFAIKTVSREIDEARRGDVRCRKGVEIMGNGKEFDSENDCDSSSKLE